MSFLVCMLIFVCLCFLSALWYETHLEVKELKRIEKAVADYDLEFEKTKFLAGRGSHELPLLRV